MQWRVDPPPEEEDLVEWSDEWSDESDVDESDDDVNLGMMMT